MRPLRHALVAALVLLGLQGCERESPQTVVTPPQASLPDDTVLRGPGAGQQSAAAPAAAPASTPAVAATPASAPTVAAAPPDAQAQVMGGPPATASSAAPAAPSVPPGTAAPTEMGLAFPPAGSTPTPATPPGAAASTPAAAAAPASAPGPSALAPAPSSPAPPGSLAPAPSAAPPQVTGALPAVRDPGDAAGAQLLAQRPLEVPVVGVAPTALGDNFTQSRGSRKHEAIDILAPMGTPVVAVDDGHVAKLFTSKRGGLTVYQFDPQSRLAYYYAHLQRYAPDLREGMDVHRGDLIGYVGTTGDADPGTPHLHFAVFRLGQPPKWWQGEAVNPYPALSRAQPAQVASR